MFGHGQRRDPPSSEAVLASHAEEADGPSEVFELIEFFRRVKRFWKTRTAVLDKRPLYDYSKRELERRGLMGPWAFNLAESTVAGLPGTAYSSLHWLVFEQDSSRSISEKLLEVSHPLVLPFILTATAYIVGRLSIRSEDLANGRREKASRVFLYLDGAYGFFPQLLMSCAVPFVTGHNWAVPDLILRLPFFLISGWAFVLYIFFLPEDLFSALGYRSMGLGDARPVAPITRYRLAILVVVPVVTVVIQIVFAILAVGLGGLIQGFAARMHP